MLSGAPRMDRSAHGRDHRDSSGQDSTVHLHLKDEGLSSEDAIFMFGPENNDDLKREVRDFHWLFRTEEASRIEGETNKTK